MSRTKRGSKPLGFDYWGKRGHRSKTITKRVERQEDVNVTRGEVIDWRKVVTQYRLHKDTVNEQHVLAATDYSAQEIHMQAAQARFGRSRARLVHMPRRAHTGHVRSFAPDREGM